MRPFALAAALLALPAISHAAQPAPPSQAPLRAAGDAEARPLFERWLAGYAQAHALAGAFEAVGGQEGVRRAAALQADAAAIIAPLSNAQVAAHPQLVDVPVAVSAVAIVYGVLIAGDLRLTPELLDGIFRGRITRWRDPAILSANPGVVLPDLPIAVLTQPVDSGDSATLRAYFAHALHEGQQHTIALGYAPLPGLVVRALDARLDQLEPRQPRASRP